METIIKKCPMCGYEGEEDICPECGSVMENICDECFEAESNCTCQNLEEEFEEEEEEGEEF